MLLKRQKDLAHTVTKVIKQNGILFVLQCCKILLPSYFPDKFTPFQNFMFKNQAERRKCILLTTLVLLFFPYNKHYQIRTNRVMCLSMYNLDREF